MAAAAGQAGTLYVVATPIGNLGELSPRAAATLVSVAVVAAEDTRRTRKLLWPAAELVGKPADAAETPPAAPPGPRLVSLHPHNYDRREPQLLADLAAGRDVALVSDAGTPAVSDPGGSLVAAAWDAGIRVVPIAGPSAVATALSVAGFPAERYLFAGYVPKKPGRRARFWDWIDQVGETAVLFETPHRIARTLVEMADRWPGRRLLLARELTKLHEELMRETVAGLAAQTEGRAWKGEITLVLGPAADQTRGRETKDTDV